jgi:hypothetical protein
MRHHRRIALALAAGLAVLAGVPANATVLSKTTKADGVTVQCKGRAPQRVRFHQAYPGVLVFGDGSQTMNTVDSTIARNFREQAEKRGYIVVAPAAPGGRLFFEGGERIFPAFLKQILAPYGGARGSERLITRAGSARHRNADDRGDTPGVARGRPELAPRGCHE